MFNVDGQPSKIHYQLNSITLVTYNITKYIQTILALLVVKIPNYIQKSTDLKRSSSGVMILSGPV